MHDCDLGWQKIKRAVFYGKFAAIVLEKDDEECAEFDAFILFGGMTRWLSLRDLIPRRAVNFVWPCMIVGLGLSMTFFYREVE